MIHVRLVSIFQIRIMKAIIFTLFLFVSVLLVPHFSIRFKPIFKPVQNLYTTVLTDSGILYILKVSSNWGSKL